jgi:hypothetical protein
MPTIKKHPSKVHDVTLPWATLNQVNKRRSRRSLRPTPTRYIKSGAVPHRQGHNDLPAGKNAAQRPFPLSKLPADPPGTRRSNSDSTQ